LRQQLLIFTDSVIDNDGVIDGASEQGQDDCHEVGVDLKAAEYNGTIYHHQCLQQTDYGAYTGRPTADLLKPKGDIQNQNQCSKCSSYQTLPEEFISGGCIDIVGVQQFQLAVRIQLIQLIGQVAGMLAAVSGWFGFQPSTTLTIPGIAGIILSVGMGVDANIITCERIREELQKGKNLDSALHAGYSRAFSAIFDGNVTGMIVAIILMGAFGVPDSFWAKALHWLFFAFGATTEGVIYSFGYTLMTGLIMNFIMGVLAARLLTLSLSQFKCFRNKKLYGGANDVD
jgi:hypothetical protein